MIPPGRALRIAMVAGEPSGDQLGAALIEAIRARAPGARFEGIAGPLMRAAGCEAWYAADELAVMGLVEVLPHLPRLLAIRSGLVRRLKADPPDVYVGVDYKEFNLGVGRRLKAAGIRTVQYVSPQAWAWREGRVRGIAAACDAMLCLLPFEPAFYARHGVEARFVGHPLADQVPMDPGRDAARAHLGLAPDARVVALLPGSRGGEVSRLGPAFAGAAALLARADPRLVFLAPMAAPRLAQPFADACAAAGVPAVRMLEGQARQALLAADAALVASGTASLEALLCRCPMVVAYRLGAFTAFLLRALRLVRLPYFSLPNLLAGEVLVPEFFQEAVQPAALAAALSAQLDDPQRRGMLLARFAAIHASLRCGGADRAAAAVLEVAGRA